ncbi:rhodanese-like domain-containing protein [Deferribacteres bacterium DY0037]
MRLMSRMLTVIALLVALIVLGCGQAAKKPVAEAKASVADQAKAAGFELVKIDEIKMIIGNGVWDKSRGTLVDARPERKYDGAHIPTSKLIPDTKFDEFFPAFAKEVSPEDYVVTFCGGVKCEKSLIVAEKLKEKGYTNVKIYLDGQPDWDKNGTYNEVSLEGAKKLHAKGATFIDARPERKFKKSTIAGSIVVPDTKFDEFKGNLPADKNTLSVPFCGGYKCEKSHIVAEKMLEMGYTNILVYAGGAPEWKAAGQPMAPGGDAPVAKKPVAVDSASGFPVEEPGILITSFFVEKLLDPATRPADVTIVDVRNDNEVAAGKIPGSIQVSSKEVSEGCDAFISKMPQEGRVVFHCASGGRAGEVYFFLADDCQPADIDRYYFLDAGVNCDTQPCKIGM